MSSGSWHKVRPIGSGIDREYRNTPDIMRLFKRDLMRHCRPNHNASGPEKNWSTEQIHDYLTGHLRFLVMLARRFRGRLEILDAVQEGYFGLLRAAEKYDGNQARYLTYAWFWIRSKISQAEVGLADPVRYPAHQIERARKLRRQRETLSQAIGRHPSLAELAAASNLSLDQIHDYIVLPYNGTNRPDQRLFIDAGNQGLDSGWSEMADRTCLTPDQMMIAREEFLDMLSTIGHMLQRAQRQRGSILTAFIYYYGLDRGGAPRTLEEVGFMRQTSREAIRQLVDRVWSALSPLFPPDHYESWLLTLSERVADLEDLLVQPVDFKTALQTIIAPHLVISPRTASTRPLPKKPSPEDLGCAMTVMQQHLGALPDRLQQVVRPVYGLGRSRSICQPVVVAHKLGLTEKTVLVYCASALKHYRAVGMPRHIKHADIIEHIRSQQTK